jgi:TolB protein
MSKVDEELTRRFQRAERPVGSDDLFEGLARRRRRRRTLQRVQAGALAVVVFGATAAGFVALREAFEESGQTAGEPPTLPENGLIVFERDGLEDGVSHLYTMHPDGTDIRQLTDYATSDGAPGVSPDGRRVAFRHELEDLSPVIATIPIEGGTVTWLTDERLFATSGPSWSPDGAKIAFAAHDGKGQRLFVMSANGSEIRAITDPDLYWVTGAEWSPDGTRIAFTASPVDGAGEPSTWDVFTVRPDGTELVNVTRTPAAADDEFGPTWSPDGSRLAFSRTNGSGSVLIVRELVGGTETTITEGHVDDGPAWSPDGTVIAFNRSPLDGGGFDVWLVRPDGSDVTRLTRDGGFSPTWQPIPAGPAPTPTVSPEPSVSPSPEPEGKDIGLGFNVCNLERLDGIDFLGDGTSGQAWTGRRVKDNDRCPSDEGPALVAADLDGNGRADTYSETIEWCFFCQPFDATDLDADGDEELVVLWSGGSTPAFMIYAITSGEIAPILVAEPGHPQARAESGQPLAFNTGGDEGFAGWVRCDDFPTAPVLVVTWRDHPIEGDTMEVHETRFVLEGDGMFHVVGTTDYSAAVGEPVPGVSDEPACGVNWQLLP